MPRRRRYLYRKRGLLFGRLWTERRSWPATLHLRIGSHDLWVRVLQLWSSLRERSVPSAFPDAHQHADRDSNRDSNQYADRHTLAACRRV
jgi:hypothetical protein